MELNLLEMWDAMGMPVRAVVVVLTLQALGVIAVTLDRTMLLFRSNRRSRAFAAKAAPLIDEGDLTFDLNPVE